VTERETKFAELYNAGMELILAKKDDEGMRLLYEAAKTAPEGWLTLSNLLIKDGQYVVAEERCQEVLKLTKDARIKAAAYNNLGMIYCAWNQLDAAMDAFKLSVSEFPNSADAYSNMGLVNQWRENYAEAERWANRALKIDPWHEQAAFMRSMVLLLSGDYKQGFEAYECRWRSKGNGLSKLNCNMPEWNGVNGNSVFIYGEQGHGDSILMLRYAREIKKRGLRQAWVAQKSMSPLLRAIPEIDTVVDVGDPLPDFDCHLPAVSLPRIFGTTIETIPPAPYISRPDDAMDYGPGFHVGIVWRGSPSQSNDKLRSSNLQQWHEVLAVPGVQFHSLQVDNSEEGLLYPRMKSYDKPKDWQDTMHRIAGLDLIISVDTSIVHLAGAMGLPCWCALHCRPYFVYPPHLGEKTPWYNSVRLFRSEQQHDWHKVFSRIATELTNLPK